MPDDDVKVPNQPGTSGWRFASLIALALTSWAIYFYIARLSRAFQIELPEQDRPIPLVLGMFAVAFALHLIAVSVAVRIACRWRLAILILATSLIFRLTMLPSEPIQEVDIYRYVWDGAVTTSGVSPYRYSPDQVAMAATVDVAPAGIPADLRTLSQVAGSSPAIAAARVRVHYAFLPTVYPPISQGMFALAHVTTPQDASLSTHLLVMKAWFIAFEMGTLCIVLALIVRCGLPIGLAILHGWCPLLLKETANSGHLDSVAVFLTTLAVHLAVTALQAGRCPRRSHTLSIASSCVLGLAVGAKLYPIVLAPLFFLLFVKRLKSFWPIPVFLVLLGLVFWPMLPRSSKLELGPDIQESTDPSDGLVAFLSRWEINDFMFLILIENLKPTSSLEPHERAWFSLAPNRLNNAREHIADELSQTLSTGRFPIQPEDVPFLVSRAITLVLFGMLAIWFAARAAWSLPSSEFSARAFLQASFLTIAWFWLLCPTQNPWYWSWALPFAFVMRNRVWWPMSGLVLVYYMRFWLDYHYASQPIWGTPYPGSYFFDLVVTWLEFSPWFVLLLANRLRLGLRSDTAIGIQSGELAK